MEFFPSRSVALEILGFSVHWYGIMYLLAFVVTLYLLPRLQRYRGFSLHKDTWANLITWGVVGVVVGGRLGYVFFYEPLFFLTHPLQIPAVWNGGMSFHGGLLGVVIVILLFCKKQGIDPWKVADMVVVPAALGLMFGRIGNFINLELYGIPTTLPWGISIPGVEGLRHPTQIYAAFKDILISAVCFMHLRYSKPVVTGRTFALFLMLYGIGRFLNEFLREQQYSPLEFGPMMLTRGQILTLPVFVAGVILWLYLPKIQKK